MHQRPFKVGAKPMEVTYMINNDNNLLTKPMYTRQNLLEEIATALATKDDVSMQCWNDVLDVLETEASNDIEDNDYVVARCTVCGNYFVTAVKDVDEDFGYMCTMCVESEWDKLGDEYGDFDDDDLEDSYAESDDEEYDELTPQDLSDAASNMPCDNGVGCPGSTCPSYARCQGWE